MSSSSSGETAAAGVMFFFAALLCLAGAWAQKVRARKMQTYETLHKLRTSPNWNKPMPIAPSVRGRLQNRPTSADEALGEPGEGEESEESVIIYSGNASSSFSQETGHFYKIPAKPPVSAYGETSLARDPALALVRPVLRESTVQLAHEHVPKRPPPVRPPIAEYGELEVISLA